MTLQQKVIRHYSDGEVVYKALVELLSTDIRPSTSYKLTKKKGKSSQVDPTCRFRFDMLRIGFVVATEGDAKSIEVTEVIVETEKMTVISEKERRHGTEELIAKVGFMALKM